MLMLEDFKLKVFITVAEKGSFTLAARALGVTQPAVSQNIAELEKNVGTELFIRTRGAVTLTAAGVAFREYAVGILHWYSAANEMFGPSGKMTASRPIRISSDNFVAGYFLPDAIQKILATNPHLSFKMMAETDSKSCDIDIRTEIHPGALSLEENATYAGTVRAVAVTTNPEYSRITDLQRVPIGTRFAVWAPYSLNIPPDIQAMTFLETGCLSSICSLVQSSSNIIGLLPMEAAPSGLVHLPVNLSSLNCVIRFVPSEDFGSNPVCSVLRNLLAR